MSEIKKAPEHPFNIIQLCMRDPTVGICFARGEISEIEESVLHFLSLLHDTAEKIRRLYANQKNSFSCQTALLCLLDKLLGSEMTQKFSQQAPSAVHAAFVQSIVQVRSCFHVWAHDYLPIQLHQLFGSDGMVDHIESPELLLLAIFWPHEIPIYIGVTHEDDKDFDLPRNTELESLRSALALRTWLYALSWLPDKQQTARGNTDVLRMTAVLERNLFARKESKRSHRLRPVYFEFDPLRSFKFVRKHSQRPHDENKFILEVPLSRRYIRIGARLIRIYYASGLKSDASSMRRVWFKRQLNDLVRCKLVFETDADFEAAQPQLEDLLFQFGVAKVIDGKRVDEFPNQNSASTKGWYWTGFVTLTNGLKFELDCESLERYYNDQFSMTLFNHLVYEVRRLVAEVEPDLRFWETLFPGAMHMSLTHEIMVDMIVRQLRDVLGDCYAKNEYVRARARAWLDTMRSLLIEHPEYIDKPWLCEELAF